MNSLGITLAWMALQATLFCLAGAGAYLVARRRHPAWGALVLCGVLTIAGGIAALSLSPWPRWWTMPVAVSLGARSAAPDSATTVKGTTAGSEQASTSASGTAASEAACADGESTARIDVLSFFAGIWGNVHRQLDDGLRQDADAALWRWPAWLAAVMLAGMLIGAARVLLGLLALVRLLRHTRPLNEPALVRLLEDLRLQLGCRRPIALREMTLPKACSPAVIGWRRPTILLPADWRSWSKDVRRGILAHETAHVAHGDFLKWLLAQAGVVLHFYNPLVHWLARRLRLEQELAADACGAALAGGAKTYMTLLAQMALAQDQSRPLWAGSPFFPTRGTLMRRIEMLRKQRFITQRSPSGIWPTCILTALALVGLGVSGLRGPTGAARAAEAPATEAAAASAAPLVEDLPLPAFDDSYLPAETIAAMSFKPLKAAGSNIVIEPTLLAFPAAFGFAFVPTEKDKVRPWEVEEVRTIVLQVSPSEPSTSKSSASTEPPFVIIYRMRQPFKQGELRVKLFGEAPDGATQSTIRGCTCFRTASEATGDLVTYVLADERTLVVVRDRDLARVLAADFTRHPAWYGQWQEIAGRPIALGFDSQAVAEIEKDPTDPFERGFLAILKETSLFFASIDAHEAGLQFRMSAHCKSPEQAVATEQAAKGALGVALAAVPQLLKPSDLPDEFRSLDINGAVVKSLSTAALNTQATRVLMEAQLDGAFLDKFARLMR